MKRYFFLMLLSSMFFACSDDTDIDPDLSKEFVGSWKGETFVEVGYENRTDWVITKVTDTSVKVVSTFHFIAKDPKYKSSTTVTPVDNVTLSKTVANSVTMNLTQETAIPGDVIVEKSVGIVTGNMLTVSSTGTSKKTGVVTTPPVAKFTKQ
jgi:hypothetical protein